MCPISNRYATMSILLYEHDCIRKIYNTFGLSHCTYNKKSAPDNTTKGTYPPVLNMSDNTTKQCQQMIFNATVGAPSNKHCDTQHQMTPVLVMVYSSLCSLTLLSYIT